MGFALTLASKYPARVKAVVMSNCYMWPDEVVQEKKAAAAAQSAEMNLNKAFNWEMKEDGSHLVNMFNTRKSWLTPEMNTRVVRDELIYNLNKGERYAAGILIQDGPLFDFEAHARNTICP